MNPTAELLDQVKAAQGLHSDWQIHKITDFSTGRISNWRQGRNIPDDAAIIALSILAKADPLYWLPRLAAERTNCPEARLGWRDLAARTAAVIALCALAAPLIADAPALWQGLYIMSTCAALAAAARKLRRSSALTIVS